MQSVFEPENHFAALANLVVERLALPLIGEVAASRLFVFGGDSVFGVDSRVVSGAVALRPLVGLFQLQVGLQVGGAEVAVELANLEKIRGDKMIALGAATLADIEKDPALLALARARGKTVFGDNCAPCHGSGGAGAKGYPNLNDDDWLWGGSLDQIMQTIQFGARSGHPKARESAMLAFGKEGVLKKEQIVAVANYVRSLSGLSTAKGYDAAVGAKIFADNCTSCHGDAGKGNQELGAPDLTDKIWLFGSDEATLVETIANGRAGVMPAWEGRLDPSTIKAMAVYVHSLGGGK